MCFNLWLHLGVLPFIFWWEKVFFFVQVFSWFVKRKRLFMQSLYFLRNCALKHTVIKTSKNIIMFDFWLNDILCFIVLFHVYSIFWIEKCVHEHSCSKFLVQIPITWSLRSIIPHVEKKIYIFLKKKPVACQAVQQSLWIIMHV